VHKFVFRNRNGRAATDSEWQAVVIKMRCEHTFMQIVGMSVQNPELKPLKHGVKFDCSVPARVHLGHTSE